MARVPGPIAENVPNIEPEVSPRVSAPQVRVQVPPQFTAVGRAVESLGTDLDQASDKIFNEALKIQDLNNQADARAIVTQAQTERGDQQAAFGQLKGANARDGLGNYRQQGNDWYQKYSDIAANKNPMVKRYVQSDLQAFQREDTNWASKHAATEANQFAINTEKAAQVQSASQVRIDPFSESRFQSSIDAHAASIFREDQYYGMSMDQIKADIQQKNSLLYGNRVEEMAKTNAPQASALLTKYKNDGSLVGDALSKAEDKVNRELITNASNQRADEIVRGRPPMGASDAWFSTHKVDKMTARAGILGFESGGNYSLVGPETRRMGHALGAYQIMSANLHEWLREAGMADMTEKEFLANKAAQDQLFDFKFGQYQDKYGSFAAAARAWFTGSPNPKPGAHDVFHTTPEKYNEMTNKFARGYVKAQQTLANSTTPQEKIAAAREAAHEDAPGNAEVEEAYVRATQTAMQRERGLKQEADYDARDKIFKAEQQGMPGTGFRPTTEGELLQIDPSLQPWLDSMTGPGRYQLDMTLAQNAKGDYMDSADARDRYKEIRAGLASEDPDAIQKALDVNTWTEHMPWNMRKDLFDKQQQIRVRIKRNQITLPHVAQGIEYVHDMYPYIFPNKQTNPDDYNMVKGILEDQMELYAQTHGGKSMLQDEPAMKRMATKLMTTTTKGGWFSSDQYYFNQDLPSSIVKQSEIDDIRNNSAFWKQTGLDPDSQQGQYWIRRALLDKHFNDTAGSEAGAGGVSVAPQGRQPNPTPRVVPGSLQVVPANKGDRG